MDSRKKSQETQNNGCFCVSLWPIRFRIRSPSRELLSSAAGAGGVKYAAAVQGDTSFLVPGGERNGTSGVHPSFESNNVNNRFC